MIQSKEDQHLKLKQESYPLCIKPPISVQSNPILEFDWTFKWLKGSQYAHILKNMDLYSQKFKFLKFSKKTHPQSIYSNPQSFCQYYLDGMIYFVEANFIGSEFGFPRVSIKKKFRWKKMNFTTDLPKKRPLVTYIVASAVKCGQFFHGSKNEGPLFRMHAVTLYKGDQKSLNHNQQKLNNENISPNNHTNYVLCHIRKLDSNHKNQNQIKQLLQNIPYKTGLFQQTTFKKSPTNNQSHSEQTKSIFLQNPSSSQQSFSNFLTKNNIINYFGLFQYLHNLNSQHPEQK